VRIAITREVSASIGACELTHLERRPIDVGRARAQHHAYEDCLRSAGCEVRRLAEAPEFPDAVFIEDTAFVLDEVAVITRPGAPSRRGETGPVASVLSAHRALVRVEAPGTLDGGDVLVLGHSVHIGMSGRSDAVALAQVREALAPHGYTVASVRVSGCLHLKSAVTRVGADTLLVQPEWVDAAAFPGWRRVEVDPREPAAANALLAGDAVIHPDAYPRTRERMEAAGLRVVAVDVSEILKAEGAVTCCSLVFDA
jgi:dimethylargininase